MLTIVLFILILKGRVEFEFETLIGFWMIDVISSSLILVIVWLFWITPNLVNFIK
jgi:hypothetical protein